MGGSVASAGGVDCFLQWVLNSDDSESDSGYNAGRRAERESCGPVHK